MEIKFLIQIFEATHFTKPINMETVFIKRKSVLDIITVE